MPGSLLGTSVRRVEDPDLIRGRGSYVDDLRVDGTLHAAFVRSPFAHATITAIDTTEAEQAPGVVAVYTAETLDAANVPTFIALNPACDRPPLSGTRVRYVGEPVAMVVAATARQAADAVELVDTDYDDLPVVAEPEAALAQDAPLLFEYLGSNVAAGQRDADESDPFAEAEVVVRARMVNQRVAVAPIEPNAILAEPGLLTGAALTVHLASQMPHVARSQIAAYAGLGEDAVRVVTPHVGGAFGAKAPVQPEHAAVISAARMLGRPVRWTETRSEAMLSMQGRGQVQWAELGLRRDGTFVGLRARVIGEAGAYAGFGGGLAIGPTGWMATGTYTIPQLRYDALAVLTNTANVGAYRGAGRPEAAAMLERMVDIAADELDMSPVEIRRKNMIAPDAFPYRTLTGMTYDVGDYDLPLREALRIAGYDDLLAEQARRRERDDVRQLGIGIAIYVEITGGAGGEFGSVRINPDGTATVMAGTSAHGQGHATTFSTIVADRLGIALENIEYVQSDTARVPRGGGTGGSRSGQLGGSAVRTAADAVEEQARRLAAEMLEAAPEDLELTDGAVRMRGVPDRQVTWVELAAHANETGQELGAALDFKSEGATFPFGAHVSVVEVDTETGFVTPLRHVAVDDCGRVMNPLIVNGQQHGGTVSGISQALWEAFRYDEEGTPVTSTFADYAMPSAADTVSLEVSNTETPSPLNPLGAKGIGESATIGSTPAVQNAVVDAVSHLGVRHIDLPCTPDRVWATIQRARAGDGAAPWTEPPAAFATLPVRRAGDDVSGAEI
ncbi:MAG TPA: xanthine dehydrogenase family protein molybdopterin-binding subunit [Nocardioidaceae bacterium]|nr:xanthine dehydrogenase family protein molybdopterin-binding subunit [Nocardioidaceae bacterium]